MTEITFKGIINLGLMLDKRNRSAYNCSTNNIFNGVNIMSKEEFIIPTDPAIITKMKQAIEEGSGITQLAEDRKLQLRETIAYMSEEFAISKKLAGALIRTHFKQNYLEVEQEATTFQVLYENIIGVPD